MSTKQKQKSSSPQGTENVSAGCDQTTTLYKYEYYSRVAEHKPHITKMNTDLKVQRCKTQRHWSTEMLYCQMSHFSLYLWHVDEPMCGVDQVNSTGHSEGNPMALLCFRGNCAGIGLRVRGHCKSRVIRYRM